VAEHLVLGLVTGGLLGPGLLIERRESDRFQFVKPGGLLTAGPDRGEIVLSETAPGETEIECRLWCYGMSRLRLLRSALVGILVATVTALGFGWLLPLALSVGVVTSVVWDLVVRAREQALLRRRVQAFVRNTNYLKTV
jgi:hypothetical protein